MPNPALHALPRAPGRLLNRFTKDTEAIDVAVSGVVSMTLTTAVSAFLSVVVIVVVSPLSIVAVLPLTYVYYRVQVCGKCVDVCIDPQ